MTRLFFLSALAFAGLLGSCNALDDPAAPNLQPVLRAYQTPTAVVGSEIMSAVADEIAKLAEEVRDSAVLEEILQVIIDIQRELDAITVKTCNGGPMNGSACAKDEDCADGTCVGTGDLVLGKTCNGGMNDGSDCADDADCPEGTCAGGVLLPSPRGVIRLNYICPGWDERQFNDSYVADPDPTDGAINLTMTLDSAGIGRVVWGTADKCLYLAPIEGDNCEAAGCSQASYDGIIAIDLGDPVPLDEDISQLLATFVLEGSIGVDGNDLRINQSFRVILADESGLEILVDVGDPALSETFNYIFAETFQCVRDKTAPPDSRCSFGCSLEESRCFDEDGNTLFRW